MVTSSYISFCLRRKHYYISSLKMSFIFSVWCCHVAPYNSTFMELTRETLLENGTSKRIQIDPYDLAIIWLITELGHSPTIAVLKIVIEHGQVVFSSFTILCRKSGEGPKLDSIFISSRTFRSNSLIIMRRERLYWFSTRKHPCHIFVNARIRDQR